MQEKDHYCEEVEEILSRLLEERHGYWNEQQELEDQLAIIREASFLSKEIKNFIEEKISNFNGDKWELAGELVDLFYEKSASLPASDVFAVLVLYIFYAEKPLNLSVI